MSLAHASDTLETLVIGSGLSGLAMASELHRNGLPTALISGPKRSSISDPATSTSSLPILDATQIEGWKARVEIVKHLETYTRTHSMDVRKNVHVENITRINEPEIHNGQLVQWIVDTDHGTLFARNIIMAGKSGSLPQISHYESVHNSEAPQGLFVIGRTIGYGKSAIKEILAQVRRILDQIKDQNHSKPAPLG